MSKKILKLLVLVMIFTIAISMTACNSKKDDKSKSETTYKNLSGKTVMIYCGAGMKEPFTKIADTFEEKTGCKVELIFCNGAQANSQILTTETGDLFIAGAPTELENLKSKGMIKDTKNLVKHIPVIAVHKGNPGKVKEIADLGNGLKFIAGDDSATPIGKIANAVLTDAGILDKANIVARTSTAPEMITALNTGSADAAIVWKENAHNKDGIEILNIKGMDKYIKVIPAASLSCSSNQESLDEFLKFLDYDIAHKIWTDAGYEVIKE